MKTLLMIMVMVVGHSAIAQELFVSSEPASNMATGSIGFRLNSKLFKMTNREKAISYRIEPEIMIGVNKNLMVHFAAYGSNMFQRDFRLEGVSFYGKYRFISTDEVHKHFRMAAYGKISVISNPEVLITTQDFLFSDGNGGFVAHREELHSQSNDIDLDGNNSGVASGIIATQLINKLALSASLGYAYRMNNIGHKTGIIQPLHALTYSASAGYLLFPREYTSYNQTNCNLYIELLGQSFADKKQSFIDAAPAIQFIFNSIARIDIAYRTQINSNVSRLSNSYVMVRLEYNLLNAFGRN